MTCVLCQVRHDGDWHGAVTTTAGGARAGPRGHSAAGGAGQDRQVRHVARVFWSMVTVLPHLSWKEDGGCEVVAEADEDSLSVDTCEAGELLVAGTNVFTG